MPEHNDLQALGIVEPIQYQGKTYEVSPFTIGTTGEFCAWVRNRAWQAVEEQRGKIADESFQMALNGLTAAIGDGEYDYGSPRVTKAAQSLDGMAQIVYLMLRPKNPAVTPELAREILLSQAQVIEAKLHVAMGADPKAQTPANQPGSHAA